MSAKNPSQFVVEGARAVEAILASPLAIVALIVIRGREFPALVDAARRRGIEVRNLDAAHANRYIETKTSQGIAAIVEKPAPAEIGAAMRRVLVLDGLNDPGNVGTLIRTAHLFGWDAVVITTGSASPYGEKAVRASAGAVGFVPIAVVAAGEIYRLLHENGFNIFLADATGPSVDHLAAAHSMKIAVVLGGEARGAAHEWKGALRVSIPIKKGVVDSLGVAASGAILLERFRAVSCN